MKTYENNMADQDVVVHSLKVLSNLKNPALSQLQRDLSVQQTQALALAQRTDKYWTELSDDGVITPIEKKVVLREMESIATSYTALYTQAVAEQYDTAPFFQDYMAVYNALRNYIYSTLQLFDNMEEATEVDRAQFNEYFSNYYYSENYALVSMTVGVITDLGFKVLTSLEDEGEEGQVGIYQGVLYQYLEGEWKVLNRDLYYGYSAALPPGVEGRYFLCTADGVLSDVLYVNDEPLEVNGETLEIGNFYERGFIYVYEDQHWVKKLPEEDYRYIVAMGDYYSLFQTLPSIVKTEVENVAKKAVGSQYCGYSVVPPQNPEENDFFLYSGTTSGSLPEDREDWPDEPPPWIFAALYIYKGGRWKWLDESLAQNQKYYMEALQDILTITKVSSGYFSTVFCNAFFANQAAMNALSVQVIYLGTNGALRSETTRYIANRQGVLIDENGNIDANGNTHLGATSSHKVAIGVPLTDLDLSSYDTVIGGNVKIKGNTKFSGIIDTDQECFAAGFELRGLKPGNYMLRRLDCVNATIYWQIPASGTVRMVGAFGADPSKPVGGTGYIYKNGVTLWQSRVGTEEAVFLDFNIDVEAGDIIGVEAHGMSPSGALPGGTVNFSGGLATETRNSLVTYLGQVVTTPQPPSPVR